MMIYFDPPDKFLNANDRLHWTVRRARVAEWRKAAFYAAKAQRVPLQTTKCLVGISIPVKTLKIRRDGANLHATLKPCLDGLVDAGVFTDDSTKYVKTDEPTFHIGSRVIITITPLGE